MDIVEGLRALLDRLANHSSTALHGWLAHVDTWLGERIDIPLDFILLQSVGVLASRAGLAPGLSA